MQNPLKIEDQLCFALYRASRAIIRAYAPLLEPLGLTYPQYLVMLVLWEHKQLSVKDIGGFLSLDSATLTPILKKLEDLGLVIRERSKEDERVVNITLSDKGRELRKEATGIPMDLACRVGVDLKDSYAVQKIHDLRAELHKIADSLE